MAERLHVPFDVFAMRVDVPVSTAVRDGDLGWTCGQCPLTETGAVHAPGDLLAQTEFVCDMIATVMARAGFEPSSVGKLHVYFSAETDRLAATALALITARFGHGPLIVPIAVPHFYYDGMLIEVDVFATSHLQAHPSGEPNGVRLELIDAGDQVWAYAAASLANRTVDEAVDLITTELEREALDQTHLLADFWMSGGTETEQVARNLQSSRFVTNPDALVRLAGQASPVIAASLSFSKQPVIVLTDKTTDDGPRLTLKRSGRLIWASGTCANSGLDLVGQTSCIMQGLDAGLRAAGTSFTDVVKLTAHYTGGASEQELHGNMKVRHSYYKSPGPASTGLPVAGLGNGQCRIAIDVSAVSARQPRSK